MHHFYLFWLSYNTVKYVKKRPFSFLASKNRSFVPYASTASALEKITKKHVNANFKINKQNSAQIPDMLFYAIPCHWTKHIHITYKRSGTRESVKQS